MNNTQNDIQKEQMEESSKSFREKIIDTIESTIEEKLTPQELNKTLNDIGLDSLGIFEILIKIEILLEDENIEIKEKFYIDIDDTPNDIVQTLTKIIKKA